ncbi:MAG: ferrochelatase [Micavibrio sp.]|nr:MAG: ferrochelatase [Micavibrio sp.]
MTKTAVILFNLGGPNKKESIKPFLFNFFMDKNIIRLPLPFRYLLAKKISTSRSRGEANDSYKELGFKSPLLENTNAQAEVLEKKLGSDFKVFTCMRYWHPMAKEVVQKVKKYAPKKIILLPLYPQFSTTTTCSSFEAWDQAASQVGIDVPTSGLCCYPLNNGFIKASAENIKTLYQKAQKDGHKNPRILFSAHGLPEKIIKDGDPYQWQCEQAAEKIAHRLSVILNDSEGSHATKPGDSSVASLPQNDNKNIDWQICYQSRVGRLKWIAPSLDEALEKAARDNKAVVVYPHAFTQEHVETLVELDIEYKYMAEKLGIQGYYRAQTVGTHEDFIDGLAELVRQNLDKTGTHAENDNLCPKKFNRCCTA